MKVKPPIAGKDFGVSFAGVQWIRQGKSYHCTLYFGDGAEIRKTFEGVSKRFVENLDHTKMLS